MASPNTTENKLVPVCYQWMQDTLDKPDVTLVDINNKLILRFIGGITFLAIICIVGLIGNNLVIFIYFRRFRKSNYRIYVLWLAILDIVNCTVSAPLVIIYMLFPVTFPSDIFCKVFRFILYFLSMMSTSALVVIAIDRCRKVLHPLRRQISTNQAKFLCFISVIISLALSWPAPILFGLSDVQTGVPGLTGFRCITANKYKKTLYMILYSSVTSLYFIAVTTSLIIVYTLIGRQIFKHNVFRSSMRKMSSLSTDYDDSPRRGSKASSNGCANYSVRKTTWTLGVVTIAYILSALPHHALALLYFLSKDLDCKLDLLESQFYYTFIWSYFVNSAINPFIYGFRDKKFRKEVKLIYSKS
ncbi:Growth hormone secretagogue receptor type 1 [Mizuhopecten yessoensis]|uniref:Growth hormone secretagogue receptor type 1 n=2 Tax=Mizuhopecten yessoensis TaxID=6573 RepID=A0A210PQR6_MIZYE|nr:Growth hormone secretagogue receptor type 1 [Mizuhopecten yessoensis]